MVRYNDSRPSRPVSSVLFDGHCQPSALLTIERAFGSGCKGGITRWEAKKALLMSNNQDNGDPGIEQQPRFNLTLSMSLDNGNTWPHRAIIWPAHMGKAGYSDIRITSTGTQYRYCRARKIWNLCLCCLIRGVKQDWRQSISIQRRRAPAAMLCGSFVRI